jgi:hypothetical protein
MPLSKKITVFTLFGLGTASSALTAYWWINSAQHQSNSEDFTLAHGTAAQSCGPHNAGCAPYVPEHLAAEKAGDYAFGTRMRPPLERGDVRHGEDVERVAAKLV